MNGLNGMEERPGSAVADAVTMDLCGTLFEREYGAAIHAAGIARFSGTVYQTQRMGFRPMMKVALGVRNLIPGAGEGAPDPAPPAAPAGAGAGEGAMLVTGVAAGGAGAARSMDGFEDMGRVVDSAEDLESVSDLSRAGDTADTVDELGHVRLPDDFDTEDLLARITRAEEYETARAEWLRGTTENSVENMNRLIGEKIDEIAALDAATDAAASADDVDFTPPVKPGAAVDDVGDHRGAIAYLSSEISRDVTPAIPYPTGAAADPDVRRAELGAELDALMALKMAVDTNEDPIVFLREMVDQAKELYGPTDPRTVAVDELLYHQERVQTMIARTQQNADLWIMARVGVDAGFDPRTLLRNIENGADSETASRVRIILSQINPYFTELDDLVRNAVTTPDVVEDVVDLRRVGAVDDVPPPGSLDPTALGLDAPPAPVGDADDLGTAPGAMDLLASGSADDVRQGLDLPESDDIADGLRLDGDGVRTDLETGPLVQPGFDETGAGWLDDGGGRSGDLGDLGDGVHGDYEEMAPSGGPAVGDADDVQAVVDGVPARSVPEDFDWRQTYSEELLDPYTRARTDFDLRPTIAYGDAINDLRDDLYRGLSEILGSSDGLEGKPADDLYARALEVANGDDVVQAQKARELLETIDAKTHDAVVALSGRADEFANAARTQQIDRHIDQAQLLDWLLEQQNAAAERIATASTDAEGTAAGQEMSYWHQLIQAVGEGKSPTVESSEQIAYLRSVGATDQAEAYLRYHDDLLQTVSDPAFHRSAAEMGDNTYAPRAFLWPELDRGADLAGPPLAADLDGVAAYRNALLERRAELRDELFALARLVDGDNIVPPLSAVDDPTRGSELQDVIQRFASNLDTFDGSRDALDAINAQAYSLADDLAGGAAGAADAGAAGRTVDSTLVAGDQALDLFRNLVPDEMLDDGYLAAIDAHGHGSFSDLTGDVADLADGAADGADAGAAGHTADSTLVAGGATVDLPPNLIPDDMMGDDYLAAVDAHHRGSFSDLTGDAADLSDLDLATYAANRDAINRRAGARDFARAPSLPPSGLRHFALGASQASGSTSKANRDPPAGPGTGPRLPTTVANLSPQDDLGIARLVRDDGVPAAWERRTAPGRIRRWDSGVRIRSVRFGGGRTPSRDEREESANPSVEAADMGGATRWWTGGGRGADPLNLEGALPGVSPSRRTGAPVAAFGGGTSPFAARAELVRDLMQGQLLRPASVDALRTTVVEGSGGRGQTTESANLTALLAALRSGGEAGVPGSVAGGLDWRTLGILLDMLDSSAAMP